MIPCVANKVPPAAIPPKRPGNAYGSQKITYPFTCLLTSENNSGVHLSDNPPNCMNGRTYSEAAQVPTAINDPRTQAFQPEDVKKTLAPTIAARDAAKTPKVMSGLYIITQGVENNSGNWIIQGCVEHSQYDASEKETKVATRRFAFRRAIVVKIPKRHRRHTGRQ